MGNINVLFYFFHLKYNNENKLCKDSGFCFLFVASRLVMSTKLFSSPPSSASLLFTKTSEDYFFLSLLTHEHFLQA